MLYSPGAEDPRTWETTLVQDLASRGYLMVTIDHTYNASEVEFPGGGVVDTLWPEWFQQAQQGGFPELAKKLLAVRLADTRFVLDELAALDAGRHHDAAQRPLPHGLAGALDLHRVGMFGVSLGGIITPQAMYEDPRIKVGIDIGGTVESPFIPDPIRWPRQPPARRPVAPLSRIRLRPVGRTRSGRPQGSAPALPASNVCSRLRHAHLQRPPGRAAPNR